VYRNFRKSVSALAVFTATLALGAGAAAAASQDASNSAESGAANAADTHQYGDQSQHADVSSGNKGCWSYCAGGGGNVTPQSQDLGQWANTEQHALSAALAKQNAVNANVPVTIVGKGKVKHDGKSGGAHQDLANSADSNAANAAATSQKGNQHQSADVSSGNKGCTKFCAGGGGNVTPQKQHLGQKANTEQDAASIALAKQNAVNANVPVTIVGHGHVGWDSNGAKSDGKSGGAWQDATNSAESGAANAAATTQKANQDQHADVSSGSHGGGKFGAGGGGNVTPQAQDVFQGANTEQAAESAALAAQLLENVQAGVHIGG
jgi:hypothetical protein